MQPLADDRYIVISSDGHAGAEMLDYRDYLEHRYLEEFDAWAKSYVNPYADLRGETAYRNWDSAARQRELEDDGVVAEVLFPNTIPPFFPSGNLLARPPTPETYELRWAGLRAHNRWLADFCAETPGRRAGMAQIFLNDVDDAVSEITWACEHGLFGGILLPGVPPDSGLPPLVAPEYDPIWAACQDLDMPVNNHSGAAGPEMGEHLASLAVFMVELGWFSHRVFWHMALGGAFARYPTPEAGAHRAVIGLDPRHAEHARFPVQPLHRRRQRRSHTSGRSWSRGFPSPRATTGRTTASSAPASSVRTRRPSATTSASTRSCGARTIRISRGRTPTPPKPCVIPSPGSTLMRWDPCSEAMPPASYGFDLEELAPVAARVGPRVDEVNVPLEHVPADSHSLAFSGGDLKPW